MKILYKRYWLVTASSAGIEVSQNTKVTCIKKSRIDSDLLSNVISL